MMKYQLKVPHMCKIPLSVASGNNVQDFEHIIQNPIPGCSRIVVGVAVKKLFDFGESLLNWVQVGGIWW